MRLCFDARTYEVHLRGKNGIIECMQGEGIGKEDRFFEESSSEEPSVHYARRVRGLFLAAGLIMIIALPILGKDIFVSRGADIFLFVAFFWILVLGIVGALGRRTMILDMVASGIALVFFEYAAVLNYQREEAADSLVFLISQLLSIIFFLSLFFSIRTYRAFLKERSRE